MRNPCPYGLTSLSDKPTKEQTILAVVCAHQEYGLKQDFDNTIKGESGFHWNAYNRAGKSWGVSQYTFLTFIRYCSGSIALAKDQIICMADMFSKHLEYNWDIWCMEHKDNKNCEKRGF